MAVKHNWTEMTSDAVLAAIPQLPIAVVPITRFSDIDKGLNYRELEQYVQRAPDLAALMQAQGQREPLTVTDGGKDGGKASPLQGFLRAHAFIHAKENKMVFLGGDFAGKPMADHILVRIVGKLRPEVEAEIKADHGGITILSRRGLAVQVIDLTRKGFSEKDVLLRVKGLLDQHYPLSAESRKNVKPITEDGGESYAKARHGRAPLMVWQAIARGPKILEQLYLDKLSGKTSYPKDDEVRDLVKVYEAERDDDTTRKIGPEAPGTEFEQKMESFRDAWAKAEAAGRIAKAQSSMNGEDMKLRAKTSISRLGRVIVDLFRNKSTGEQWALVDSLLSDVEKDSKFGKVVAEILDRIAPPKGDDAQTGSTKDATEDAQADIREDKSHAKNGKGANRRQTANA